jgi:hypothetical protein
MVCTEAATSCLRCGDRRVARLWQEYGGLRVRAAGGPGLVEPRRGAGFFVKETVHHASQAGESAGSPSRRRAMDIVWLMRMQLRNESG